MVETKSSTDFAMGRRPKLKSEERFVSTILVIEIIANLCLKPPKMCYTIREHDPTALLWPLPGASGGAAPARTAAAPRAALYAPPGAARS
eukprot:3201944-Prymnesium_polylepis.1